jgi:aspartyl-tRNA synthetase
MKVKRMDDFSHLFEALRAGCPPHAGLAIGFDRMIAVMTGRESVKDVIAFPKSSKGEDMMVRSPSLITDQELKTYYLQRSKPASEIGKPPNIKPTPEKLAEGIKSTFISPP